MIILPPRERTTLEEQNKVRIGKEAKEWADKAEQMRSLAQSEERRLRDWEAKEYERFKAEKAERDKELSVLNSKIADKKAEWDKLLQPLDKQFALYVKTKRQEIEAEEAKQADSSRKLVEEKALLAEERLEQVKTGKELQTRMLELAQALEKVERDKVEAARTLLTGRNEAQRLIGEAETAYREADNIRKEAQIQLREAQLYEEKLSLKEKELDDRELKLVVEELKRFSPVKKL